MNQASDQVKDMKRGIHRLTVLALLLPLAGCPLMQVKEDDPYAQRVRALEERVALTEKQLDTQSLVQLMQEIQALREEVRNLRGQVEQLGYDVESIRQRQRDLYADIDQRLQALENTTASAGEGETGKQDADASDAYMAAFALLRESRYAEARKAFNAFIADHPDSSLVANSVYWLGQVDYVNRQYEDAITRFSQVVEKYPDSDKAADALLKIGYSRDELGNTEGAREALDAVIRQYPGSAAATMARQRLGELGEG